METALDSPAGGPGQGRGPDALLPGSDTQEGLTSIPQTPGLQATTTQSGGEAAESSTKPIFLNVFI